MGSILRTFFVVAWVGASTIQVAAAEKVYVPGNGVSVPVLVKEVRPDYPPAAKNARIDGSVLLQSVVQRDGTVGAVKVLKSLDGQRGLDRAAIDAMKQWRFKPGLKDGKAVPVRIVTELTFTATP